MGVVNGGNITRRVLYMYLNREKLIGIIRVNFKSWFSQLFYRCDISFFGILLVYICEVKLLYKVW